ncbi:hypothetical protein [Xanthomonas phage RTH11]|nr:hypothetical protein [Xanthomonas phage RTH11]
MSNSPLGNNTSWVVNSDRQYVSRELDQPTHDALALAAVFLDPELVLLERQLKHRVIIGLKIGKRTLHIRVYNRMEVEQRPDRMASRMAHRDTYTYVGFDVDGHLVPIEGDLREAAQGHSPHFYGDRRLTPERIAELDVLQETFQVKKVHSPSFVLLQAMALSLTGKPKPPHHTHETEPA